MNPEIHDPERYTPELPVKATFYRHGVMKPENILETKRFATEDEAYRYGNNLIRKLGIPFLVVFTSVVTSLVLVVVGIIK